MDESFRANYQLDMGFSFRRENLLRLKKYLNEVVFDQLPVLKELLRMLEFLSISGNFNGSSSSRGGRNAAPLVLNVELVAEVHENLCRAFPTTSAIKKFAEKQSSTVFTGKDEKRTIIKIAKILSEGFEGADKFSTATTATSGGIDDGDDVLQSCPECGLPADQRCSGCQKVFYCSRACQVKQWKNHKLDCNK
jgi:zinc finger MYND domain-containing protein 10